MPNGDDTMKRTLLALLLIVLVCWGFAQLGRSTMAAIENQAQDRADAIAAVSR